MASLTTSTFLLASLAFPLASHARAGEAFGHAELVELLNKSPKTGLAVQSIQELIPLLPEGMRSGFTFVHESRSPFKDSISPQRPRVILFSPDAGTLLTFTTDPSRPGFDILESIHFSEQEARFEPYKFVLPAAIRRDPALRESARADGSVAGNECARCHGQDFRPITDSYPIWPGFYGSVKDSFMMGAKELANYREFLRRNRGQGLFKHLIWPKGTSVPPYLDPKDFDPKAVIGELAHMRLLPNTRLGMALTELNRQRLMRKIKSSPLHPELRFSLLAALLRCGTMPVPPEREAEIRASLAKENREKLARAGLDPEDPTQRTNDMPELGFARNLAEIDHFSRVLKLDRSDWSMALEPGSLSFFDGILSGITESGNYYAKEDLILEMLKDLASTEADFKPYFEPYHTYGSIGMAFGHRLDIEQARLACPLLIQRHRSSNR